MCGVFPEDVLPVAIVCASCHGIAAISRHDKLSQLPCSRVENVQRPICSIVRSRAAATALAGCARIHNEGQGTIVRRPGGCVPENIGCAAIVKMGYQCRLIPVQCYPELILTHKGIR